MIGLVPWRVAAVLGYMALIFWLSSLSGARISAFGLPVMWVNFAHVPLFAGLGSVTLLSLTGNVVVRVAVTCVLAMSFAFTDEWHQSFVPGRVFAYEDLVSDAIGIAIGVAVVLWLQAAQRPRRPAGTGASGADG